MVILELYPPICRRKFPLTFFLLARLWQRHGEVHPPGQRSGLPGRSVELRDSDARELPFLDESFDVVLSSFAIHNIYDTVGREKAIREIHRVLKPGGQLVLADIRHTSQYAEILRSLGWTEVTRWAPNFMFITPTRVVRAAKPNARN